MTTPSSGLHLSKDLALYTTFIINIVAVFTLIALIVVIHVISTFTLSQYISVFFSAISTSGSLHCFKFMICWTL